MKVVFVCIPELFNLAILCLLQHLLGDPLVAVVWNAARKGLEPRSEFRPSMVCHGCDRFSTHLLIIAIPVIFGNLDFFCQYYGCVHCKDLL